MVRYETNEGEKLTVVLKRQARLSPDIYLKHILFGQIMADVMRYIEPLLLVRQ